MLNVQTQMDRILVETVKLVILELERLGALQSVLLLVNMEIVPHQTLVLAKLDGLVPLATVSLFSRSTLFIQ